MSKLSFTRTSTFSPQQFLSIESKDFVFIVNRGTMLPHEFPHTSRKSADENIIKSYALPSALK